MDQRRGRAASVMLQYKPPTVTLEEEREVRVTHVVDPNSFHVQYTSKLPELKHLMTQLQVYCQDQDRLTVMSYFNAGQACVVWYVRDRLWYRGIITGFMQNLVEVLFVDYGNRDFVQQQSVIEIIPEFMDFEVQAVGCSLAHLKSNELYWLPEHNVQIEDLLLNKTFRAFFIGLVNNDVACEVQLIDNRGQDMNQLFGMQTATYVSPDGAKQSMTARNRSGSDRSAPPGLSGDQPQPEKIDDGNWASGFRNTSPPANTAMRTQQVCYKQTSLSPGTEVDVLVVFVNSPHEFYVQEAGQIDALEAMMERMNTLYNKIGAETLSRVQIGDVCATRYSEDKRWYRARVVKLDQGNPQVMFVDYGNCEVVNAMALKVLNREFLELAEQAALCKLADIEPTTGSEIWIDSVIDAFSDISSDEHMKVAIVGAEVASVKTHLVNLRKPSSPPQQTINNELVKMGIARKISTAPTSAPSLYQKTRSSAGTTSPVSPPRNQNAFTTYANQSIPNNTRHEVIACWLNNPGDFSCQIVEQAGEIQSLMETLQASYAHSSQTSSEAFIEGAACISQFNDDGLWYRAIVIERKQNKRSAVIYIDYGNDAEVDDGCLRTLQSRFCSFPKFAIRCKLSGVEPMTGKWSPESNKIFESFMSDQATCTFLEQQGGFYLVEVEHRGMSLTNLLLSRFEARQPTDSIMAVPKDYPKLDIRAPSTVKVYVSHINSTNDFWCQLLESTSVLNQLLDDLLAEYDPAFLRLPLPIVGSLCVAKFTEDDAFYRGKITSKTADEFSVTFVDYGNGQMCKGHDLQRLVARLMAVPQQAIRCRLRENVSELTESFRELVDDKDLICRIAKKTADECFTVDLSIGDVDICQKLSSSLVREYATQTDMSGKTVKLYMSYIVNPEEFYVQLVGCEAKLEEIAQKCQSLAPDAADLPGDRAKPGYPVLARFSLDRMWYRGLILEVSRDSASVYFVDFGNTESVMLSNLKQIGLELLKEAPVAYKCSLTGLACVSQDAVKRFEVLTQDCELNCVFATTAKVWLLNETTDCTRSLIDSGVCSWVVDKYPDCSIKNQFEGYVSHVEAEGLYIQPSECTDMLETITDSLVNDPPGAPTTGHECCSKFVEDDAWYRSVIESIDGSGVRVRFVDFGNTQVCSFANVAETPRVLSGVPRCAVQCMIQGRTSIPPHIVEQLQGHEELVTVNVVSREPRLTVTLTDPAGSLLTGRKSDPILSLPKQSVEERMTGYVIDIGGDCFIYLHLMRDEDKLTVMTQELVDRSDELCAETAPETVEPGHYVCAKFSEDKSWYRANVVAIDGGKATVGFVDFGNVDCVEISSSIRDIPRELLIIPPFALKCQISNKLKLSPADLDTLKSYEEEITIKFLNNQETYMVCLTGSDGRDILRTYEKPASQTYPAQVVSTEYVTGAVSEIDEDVVYIQLDSEFDHLQLLADDLQTFDAQFKTGRNALKDFTKGTPCCTVFSDDGAWYRGQIEETVGDEVVVRFVDYGNKERVSKACIHSVPDVMITKPVFAYPCRINKDITVKVEDTLEFQFRSPAAPYSITIRPLGGETVGTAVRGAISGQQSYRTQMCPDGFVKGTVSKIDGCTMYVQLDDAYEELQKLADELQTSNDCRNKLEEFAAGTPCCSVFTEDESWYRGKIEGTDDDQVVVRFVDYGNKETVAKSAVYSVPDAMMNEPAFAYPCMMNAEMSISVESPVEIKFMTRIPPFTVAHKTGDEEGIVSPVGQAYPEQTCPTSYVTGAVSEIDNGVTYIQLDGEFDDLQQLVDELQGYDECLKTGENVIKSVAIGTPCCSLYSEDGAWYRGQIEEIVGDAVVVRFVDYGNTQTVDKSAVYHVPAAMINKPAFSYPCLVDQTLSIESLVEIEFTSQAPPYTVETRAETACVVDLTSGKRRAYPAQTLPEGFVAGTVSEIDGDITFVQLDGEYADLEKLANELQGFDHHFGADENVLQDLNEGMPCCAKFCENDAWYRGRTEKTVDDRVAVRFVDYGNKETYDKSAVFSIPEEMISKPIFAYPCVVSKAATLAAGSTVEMEFLSRSAPHRVAIKTPAGEILRPECTGYPPHEAVAGLISGVVSEAGPDCVHIQLDSRFDSLQTFTDNLQNCIEYFGSDKNTLDTFDVGAPCCCMYSEDEAWYRGRIEHITDDAVTVRFVDYGNTETVNKSALYRVPDSMTEIPPFAYRCVATDDLELDAVVTFLFASSVEPYTIRVGDMALESHPTTPSYPARVAPTEVTTCEILSVDPAGVFQIQLNDPELYTVTDLLYERDDELNAAPGGGMTLAPNVPCCAKYSDDSWYRAVVMDAPTDGGQVTVHLVDYGTTEVLGRDCVRPIFDALLTNPPFCVGATLRGVCLDADDIERLVSAASSNLVTVEFLSQTEPFDVRIWLDDEDITSVLVKDSTADAGYSGTRLEIGEKHEVYVTHCVSPDLFSCQRVNLQPQLTLLMSQISEHCAQATSVDQTTDLCVGSSCLAKFSADGEWYRGSIAVTKALSYDVLFVDYGNTETVEKTQVLPIPARLTDLPCSSMECSLSGVAPLEGTWSPEALEFFKEFVLERRLLMTIENCREVNETFGYAVSMLDMGIDVCEGLVSQGHAILTKRGIKGRLTSSVTDDGATGIADEVETKVETMDLKDSLTDDTTEQTIDAYEVETIRANSRIEVFVSHVVSPSQFYVQLASNQTALESLMESLAEYYTCEETPIVADPTLNSPLIVHYDDTGEVYRVVVRSYDAGCQVAELFYVDYGQTVEAHADQLRAMLPQFMAIPTQAHECALTGVKSQGSAWGDEAKTAFEMMVAEKTLVADILATGDNSYLVHLLDMGVPLHEKFIECELGVATSTPLPLPSNIQRVFDTPVKEDFRKKTADAVLTTRFAERLYNTGDRFPVTVSHVDTLWWFACQPSVNSHDFDAMSSQLRRKSLLAARLERVEIGQACLTKHDDSDDFHRAIVKTVSDSDIGVYLVDVGQHKNVPPTEIFKIDSEFTEFPQHAFCCSLSGVKPRGIKWDSGTIEAFRRLVVAEVTVVIETVNKGGIYDVSLINSDGCINETLLEMDENVVVDENESLLVQQIDDVMSASESTVSDYFDVSSKSNSKYEVNGKLPMSDDEVSTSDTDDVDEMLYEAIYVDKEVSGKVGGDLIAGLDIRRDFSDDARDTGLSEPSESFKDDVTDYIEALITDTINAQQEIRGDFPLRRCISPDEPLDENDLINDLVYEKYGQEMSDTGVDYHQEGSICADVSRDSNVLAENAATEPGSFQEADSNIDLPLVDYLNADTPDEPLDYDDLADKMRKITLGNDIENMPERDSDSDIDSGEISIPEKSVENSETDSAEESKSYKQSGFSRLVEDGAILSKEDIFLNNYPHISFGNEETFLAKVINIVNPSQFGVQPVEYSAEIDEQVQKIEEYCETHHDSAKYDTLADGELCLVVADDAWCRGTIMRHPADSSRYEVLCVDSGKTVAATGDEVRPIPQHLVEAPVYYVPCALADVIPQGESWSSSDTLRFTGLCSNHNLSVHIKSLDPPTQLYHVYLHDPQCEDAYSLNRVMVKYGRTVPDSYLDMELQVDAAFEDNLLLKEEFKKIIQDHEVPQQISPASCDTSPDDSSENVELEPVTAETTDQLHVETRDELIDVTQILGEVGTDVEDIQDHEVPQQIWPASCDTSPDDSSENVELEPVTAETTDQLHVETRDELIDVTQILGEVGTDVEDDDVAKGTGQDGEEKVSDESGETSESESLVDGESDEDGDEDGDGDEDDDEDDGVVCERKVACDREDGDFVVGDICEDEVKDLGSGADGCGLYEPSGLMGEDCRESGTAGGEDSEQKDEEAFHYEGGREQDILSHELELEGESGDVRITDGNDMNKTDDTAGMEGGIIVSEAGDCAGRSDFRDGGDQMDVEREDNIDVSDNVDES